MDDEKVDYYALLGVSGDATPAEIRKAYRQKSLKVHPDRNPDNPQAAHLFHELSVAHEILSDPTKRTSFDNIYKARQARKERFANLDNKRRGMAEDLQAREEAYRKAKMEERTQESLERKELERLREEGEMLRRRKEKKYEEEEKEMKARREEQVEAQKATTGSAGGSEELGPLDTTVRLKWARKAFPQLEADTTAISTLLPSSNAVDSVVLSSKMASNPKLKNGTAVVSLKTLSAAVRCVEASQKGKLAGIEVSWASGQEPEILRRSKESIGQEKRKEPSSPRPAPPLAAVKAKIQKLDEDSVLDQLRARERERERMEDEIRRQDEAEEAAAQ